MLRLVSIALLIATAQTVIAQVCKCDEPVVSTSDTIIPIEIVRNNVFVPVTLSEGGHCKSVYFILDTGSNHTIIAKDISQVLGLPVVSSTKLVAPGGSQGTSNVRASCLRVGTRQFKNLEATVQDTSLYSVAYERQVGGLIGMDMLGGAITQIDFPNHVLTMSADKPLARNPDADITLNLFEGLPLLTCEFPPSVQTKVIVDTGCDCEFTVYDRIASRVKIAQPRITNRTDGSGILVDQTISVVDSAICGNFTLKSPSVIAATSTDAASFGATDRPGMLGNIILSRYLVELDMKDNRLRLYSPSK